MTKEELLNSKANSSLVHVDFMIGNKDTSIIGVKEDGSQIPVFKNGNWT